MTGNTNYRQVSKDDNSILASLIREVFEEHNAPRTGTVYSDPTTDNLFELFKNPGSILWVVELDGVIVGCCGIYPSEGLAIDTVELVKFYLNRKARGRGIGRALMEFCMLSAKELGYKKMYLESLSQFSKAVSIYEKNGFLRLGKPLGAFQHSTCNIWMLKEL